ncbi:MAG: hypothetical protein E6P95_04305 [Candidatus Moraniibacteriota bacterium]|nr:MAG: hypothetical protein E6P95_04305 [Candidatus Moranbacteria bacterium]
MKHLMLFFTRKRLSLRGFVLPFTLVMCMIMLTISMGISIVLVKQLYFSKLSRQSDIAYSAADAGMMCATMIDDQYVEPATGRGIFPYNGLIDPSTSINAVLADVNAERQLLGRAVLSLNDITCATSAIFNGSISSFAVVPFSRLTASNQTESGYASSFSMRMNLGDGTFRCAKVTVKKTSTYRQIISQGYAACSDVMSRPLERAIVNTTDTAQ